MKIATVNGYDVMRGDAPPRRTPKAGRPKKSPNRSEYAVDAARQLKAEGDWFVLEKKATHLGAIKASSWRKLRRLPVTTYIDTKGRRIVAFDPEFKP